MTNNTYTLYKTRFFIALAQRQGGGSPLMDRCFTSELGGAMRKGAGFLIRAPFTGNHPTKGIVIGRWRK